MFFSYHTKFIATLILTCFLCSSLTAAGADNDEEPRVFHIYGDALPGTKFKRKILSGPIPFDKPYSKLSERQKNIVRMDYEGIPDNETPPYPLHGLEAVYKPIIKAHQSILREGKLTAIALVNHEGDVEKVTVYKAPTTFFAELLNSILFSTKFEPGSCNGKPCNMEFFFDLELNVTPN